MTLAVIWRKRAAISDWISDSDFSGAVVGVVCAALAAEGEAFSWSCAVVPGGWKLPLLLAFDLDDFGVARILTFKVTSIKSASLRKW